MTGRNSKIVGTGVYLPQAISSADLEKKHGIPAGWSEKYSGVKNRHQVTHESNGFMGARAMEKALQAANISLDEVDLLISASGSYDYPLPNQASIIKHNLTNGNAYDFPAIDIDNTCLSFVVALDIASKMLDGQSCKCIVIVSSEISSKGLDPENWETQTLFGDGAAAVVLQYDSSSKAKVMKSLYKNYSEGAHYSMIKGGGSVNYYKDKPFDKSLHSFSMEGKKLLRLAKEKIPLFLSEFFGDSNLSLADIDLVIPHQASRAGLELFKRMYPENSVKVCNTLADYGNCIAASIPISLHHAIQSGKLERGQTCLLIGTGAGFSIGGALIRY